MPSATPRFFYFHASANALGGSLKTPHNKVVPSQASSSLPAVGGHATSRTEAFNCDEIVSCRTAYTRVSGTQVEEDGSWATLVTSVVENLNILDAVKAERIVSQISIEHPADGGSPKFSLAGSHFDGLRLGGRDVTVPLHPALLGVGSGDGITWPIFQQTGFDQAVKMVQKANTGKNTQWVQDRFKWMTAKPKGDATVLCSLVDEITQPVPGRIFGHVLELPHFGKILLGELLVSPSSIHLTMIRAELGCATTGNVGVAMAHGAGGTYPP
ncbi:MAG: choice-of-anchor P family protein [Acidobacteriaceae bacterium]